MDDFQSFFVYFHNFTLQNYCFFLPMSEKSCIFATRLLNARTTCRDGIPCRLSLYILSFRSMSKTPRPPSCAYPSSGLIAVRPPYKNTLRSQKSVPLHSTLKKSVPLHSTLKKSVPLHSTLKNSKNAMQRVAWHTSDGITNG